MDIDVGNYYANDVVAQGKRNVTVIFVKSSFEERGITYYHGLMIPLSEPNHEGFVEIDWRKESFQRKAKSQEIRRFKSIQREMIEKAKEEEKPFFGNHIAVNFDSKIPFKPIEGVGTIFNLEDFIAYSEAGHLTDDDGFAYELVCNQKVLIQEAFYPSQVVKFKEEFEELIDKMGECLVVWYSQ